MNAASEVRATMPEFTCPTWCAGDHVADDYLQHGYVVHSATEVTPHGHSAYYWQSVHLYKALVEPVQVHLGKSFTRFDDPKHLRVYAEDLLDVADKLDMMIGSTSSQVGATSTR